MGDPEHRRHALSHRLVTKQFTAALVLRLVEDGALELDVPISTYLPDYPAAQADRVTLHHLLSHTGGVPEHTNRPDMGEIMRRSYATDDFLDLFSDRPLDFEPGSAYRYSNSGYYLLGVIVERRDRTRRSPSPSEDRLLAPLGLDATRLRPVPRDRALQLARGYVRTRRRWPSRTRPTSTRAFPYAAGMMVSTTGDLLRWTEALHAGDVFENAETYERMTTPVLDGYGYGLGISTQPLGGQTVRAIGHSGGIPGFATMLMHFPGEAGPSSCSTTPAGRPAE